MTDAQACATCGAAVENVQYTGILCQSCYDDQNRVSGGWRDYVTGPSATGLFAGLVPFAFSLTLNGVNFVALACGAIALVGGALGAAMAMKKGGAGQKAALGGAGVVLLGLLQLFRSAFWLLF